MDATSLIYRFMRRAALMERYLVLLAITLIPRALFAVNDDCAKSSPSLTTSEIGQCREDSIDSGGATEQKARSLLEDGHPREAISLLKERIQQQPTVRILRWLLARAYLLDGNDFWALRTLADIAELDVSDCEPALWMGWIYLKQGALTEARESLENVRCPADSASRTRQELLLALVEQHAGQREKAAQHLLTARRENEIYREDKAALEQLSASLDSGYLPPISGKLDFAAGWTANARAGSPTDPASADSDDSSPLAQLNLWLRFVAPTGRGVRPSVELDARALGYSAQTGRDVSYLMLGGRPGILVGDGSLGALVAYSFDTLLLAGSDRYGEGPHWFYNAHRAEIEVNLLANLSIFGGAGRRLFRELGRSRTEFDGGLGGSVLLHRKLRLLGALTGRTHNADKPVYDLRGGSLLLSAEAKLPRELLLRTGALASLDFYPHSAGYFYAIAPTTNRRDILLKLSASIFHPAFFGTKAGLTYEFSERFSTTAPYDYRDHRILLKLAWSFTADPWAPRDVSPAGHVPLEHKIAASGFEERLQDLLRQDEAAQRSSSCVD